MYKESKDLTKNKVLLFSPDNFVFPKMCLTTRKVFSKIARQIDNTNAWQDISSLGCMDIFWLDAWRDISSLPRKGLNNFYSTIRQKSYCKIIQKSQKVMEENWQEKFRISSEDLRNFVENDNLKYSIAIQDFKKQQ